MVSSNAIIFPARVTDTHDIYQAFLGWGTPKKRALERVCCAQVSGTSCDCYFWKIPAHQFPKCMHYKTYMKDKRRERCFTNCSWDVSQRCTEVESSWLTSLACGDSHDKQNTVRWVADPDWHTFKKRWHRIHKHQSRHLWVPCHVFFFEHTWQASVFCLVVKFHRLSTTFLGGWFTIHWITKLCFS